MKAFIFILILALAGYGIYTWFSSSYIVRGKDIKNITYRIDGNSVTLNNGISQVQAASDSKTKITTKYFGNEVSGDMNEDGEDDVAFILTQDTGGSGLFYYLVVAFGSGGNGYSGSNAILLGDRIAPQSTEFKDGEITVNYADRRPDEPMTDIPSVGVSRYFKVLHNILTEVYN